MAMVENRYAKARQKNQPAQTPQSEAPAAPLPANLSPHATEALITDLIACMDGAGYVVGAERFGTRYSEAEMRVAFAECLHQHFQSGEPDAVSDTTAT